ncbi:tRNA (guanosine(37)-N1)-methyltransferase TrmD [Candidatus Dojkabacteria bacterium]|nr:tRNA (guanosine(37)-N1)-methyltransferase TrmD [Candidatus Dojkabacteria bacterium]
MQIDILSIFPKMFESPFAESIVRRAQDKKLVKIKIHSLRKWTKDKRKTVDDRPFGGGAGMVMKVEPVYRAVKELKKNGSHVIALSPKGKTYTQARARELSNKKHLIIICGHYEGLDSRIIENIADEVVSIGNFILTGGEIPAMAVIDSIARLIPGVVGNPESIIEESFSDKDSSREEYPLYTRPEEFTTDEGETWEVPKVLTSGDHSKIEKWKKEHYC